MFDTTLILNTVICARKAQANDPISGTFKFNKQSGAIETLTLKTVSKSSIVNFIEDKHCQITTYFE